jgi:septum formation protein
MPKIILGSGSPRRRDLLTGAGYTFEVRVPDVDETPPEGMRVEEVPEYLARKKAAAISESNAIIIAADTVVLLDGQILGKPADAEDAVRMLQQLSGRTHTVVSGVCIRREDQTDSFSTSTDVVFRPLTDEQIRYYVAEFKPLDKAGSYAIQEWIGFVGIEGIRGDYYNVMGLPIGEVALRLEAAKN